MKNVSMQEMLKAGVHFGHQTRNWNPKMAPYIYGARAKIHIINLDETLPRFNRLLSVVSRIAENRGKVLFVGTKASARDIVREEATRCGMPYVNLRWLGGMLTNYKTIRLSVKRLKELDEKLQNSEFTSRLTKKELLTMNREKNKLSACLDGIKNMGGLPDLIFVIDVKNEKIAIQEAKRLGIAVAGIVDTNSSPEGIDFMVPGNDDAMRAIRLYCGALADTIIKARGVVPQEEKEKGASTSKPVTVKKVAVKMASDDPQEASTAAAKKKPAAKKKTAAAKKPAPAKKKAAAKKPASDNVTQENTEEK